jgi:hypothetical protein
MRRLLLSVCAVVLAVGTGAALAGPSGGDVPAQCYGAAAASPQQPPGQALLPCKFVQGVTNQSGAECRILDDTDNQCSSLDGRDISATAIRTYQGSWVHQALALQRGLDADAPLIEEQIPHTHNTFNASVYSIPTDGSAPSYYPTLTNQDPNQVYSISDQMNMDIRAIELDLHWVPSPFGTPATHGYWVTMCHGDGQQVPQTGAYVHIGCSYDRPAQDGLAEVASWLKAHPDQFLLIYLENQMYDASPVAPASQAHDLVAGMIDRLFRDSHGRSLVYRPMSIPSGQCAAPLPYGTSRAQMMATGARVLFVGNCGPGAWNQYVFQRGSTWDESGDPRSYAYPSTACSHDQGLRAADSTFRREFEDSTFVSAAAGSGPQPPMSPANVAAMVRCGVNIIGMDQLQPQDGRLAALVWSWAVSEPSTGDCAWQGSDGRFRSAECGRALPAACLTGAQWSVTANAVPWSRAADECAAEFPGSTFTVPVNGFRNDLLRRARLGLPAVWLNYAKVRGAWTPNVAKPSSPPPPPGDHGRGHAYAYGRGHGTGRPIKN